MANIGRILYQWPATCAGTLALGALALAYAIHASKGVPFMFLMADATVVGGLPWYAGLLSGLGVLLWCATASVSLFAAALLKQTGADEAYRFMLAAGLVSGFLMLDDLYRLHETVLPRVLGIPELAIYAAYGLLGAWFVGRFRARIVSADGRLLGVAMA
jgi:hypothetical protein